MASISRPESIRKEAARRGVTTYQVRKERAARGEGAAADHIPWNKLDREQREAIRSNINPRFYRRLVDTILRNKEHYIRTGQTIEQYDYYSEIDDIIDQSIEGLGGELDPEELNAIRHYHPNRAA